MNEKNLWSRFLSVLTLIEQICQKTDLLFWKILKIAKEKTLNSCNIWVLNQRLAIKFPNSSALDTIIIVQKIKLAILSIAYKLKNLHMQIIGILSFLK